MALAKSAKDYFESFVEANIAAFKSAPSSKLAAVNAAVSVCHVCDWVFQDREVSYWKTLFPPKVYQNGKEEEPLTALRRSIEEVCPELRKIRLLANGIKHANSDVGVLVNPTWDECDFAIDQANFSWDDAKNVLLVPKSSTESVQALEALLQTSQDFWKSFMLEHGLS